MPSSQTSRTVWILSCGRIGDLKQMQALAAALGWPAVVKAPQSLPGSPEPLPDLVLCAERKAAVAAIGLKRSSSGRTRLVCLARPRGRFDDFDLIITTPQYGLPRAPNILEVSLPLTAPPASIPPSQGSSVALLVGGSSPPYVVDEAVARQMAEDVRRYAASKGAPLTGSTSARTGKPAASILAAALADCPGFHVWEAGKPNPYADVLAQAGEVIVTADSVSMVADAIAAGKPVSIYPLAEHWGLGHRLVRALWRIARRRGGNPLARMLWPLFDTGLLEPRADRKALHEGLVARGLVSWFGEGRSTPDPRLFSRELAIAVQRVHQLFEP